MIAIIPFYGIPSIAGASLVYRYNSRFTNSKEAFVLSDDALLFVSVSGVNGQGIHMALLGLLQVGEMFTMQEGGMATQSSSCR